MWVLNPIDTFIKERQWEISDIKTCIRNIQIEVGNILMYLPAQNATDSDCQCLPETRRDMD